MRSGLLRVCFLLFCCVLCIGDQFPFSVWSNATNAAVSHAPLASGVLVEVIGDHVWDSDVDTLLPDFEKNTIYTFFADVSSTRFGAAYIQVKLYKQGKEIERLNSKSNSPKWKTLSVEFDTRDADRIQLLLRTKTGKAHMGMKAEFTGMTVIKGKMDAEQKQLPDFQVVPGYTVCSVYLNNLVADHESKLKTALSYRKAGDPNWMPALPLAFLYGDRAAAGSIVKLDENSKYQLKLTVNDNGKTYEKIADFSTLNANVPVAKTIEIGPENFPGQFVAMESGSPSGYVRYVGKPGFVLQGSEDAHEVVRIEGLSHVILDGLTIRGGFRHGVSVVASEHVIVRNCDIARFGRIGVQDGRRAGKFFHNGHRVNNDAGLHIHTVDHILIEKNYIHDPNGTSCSWFHSHPEGPNAIYIGETNAATIRFNDCAGSDHTRWNDAIEGWGNGQNTGSAYQDAEIYGNLLALGNDDGMELDGGQSNCRFFYNKSEQLLCGVSTAPCLIGPSYLFQNLITNLGDVYGCIGATVKNNFSDSGKGQVFLFNNTLLTGGGISMAGGSDGRDHSRYPGLAKLIILNNLLANKASYWSYGLWSVYHSKSDFNFLGSNQKTAEDLKLVANSKFKQDQNTIIGIPEFTAENSDDFTLKPGSFGTKRGTNIPNFTPVPNPNMGAFLEDDAVPLPFRIIPFTTNVQRIDFGPDYTPKTIEILPDASLEKPIPFKIDVNLENQFLVVTPSQGIVNPGKPVALKVTIDRTKFKHARVYHAHVFVRIPDGSSRPVSVTVDATQEQKLLEQDRKGIVKATIEHEENSAILTFNVPEDDDYYLFAQFEGHPPRNLSKAYGDESPVRITYYGSTFSEPHWRFLGTNSYSGQVNIPYILKAGKHTFKLIPGKGQPAVKFLDAVLLPSPNMLLAPLVPAQ